ncbi:hypothetical protein [Streptomyces viridosporus]|uniref:hypothetical protein n=1 Tax=Streptomyces viridosporus TaxID=67581 RepID=UPI0036FAD2C9
MTSEAATPQRNPFLEAVGRVTVAGANLDFSLHHLLGQLAMEPTLLVLANAEGTARLIELCELALNMYELEMEPEDVADVKRCLARAKAVKDKRNLVVHSLYMPDANGDGMEALKPLRKTLGQRATKISVAEMEAIAAEMEALRSDLFRAGWNAKTRHSGMSRIPQPTTPPEQDPPVDEYRLSTREGSA